jgi:two-component system NtrC family response regulator
MGSLHASDDALYACLFPSEQAPAVARLIVAHQDKEAGILREWKARCAASFGAHEAVSQEVFDEIYVPSLHQAHVHLAMQDAPGFVRFARELGDRLTVARVPFVAFVRYLHFLKQSYLAVLPLDESMAREAHDLIDTVHTRLVSVVADRYFEPRDERDGIRTRTVGEEPPAAWHGMVGRSVTMQRLYERIARVAAATSPVLILGETGTGKELVARAIHAAGPRREGPFIAVNCAALPRELIESELFGYRRGAFSGAITECLGLFRAAHGGILLLDEVTEMAPELQAKLLRVLQDRTVRPVGSVQEVPIDVRVVASTNRDPDGAMAAGVLRPDLYYRLSSSSIHVPPLRGRLEDVPLLAEHCLAHVAEQQPDDRRVSYRLSAAALATLQSQHWPGNVRELFNVLEDACAMCSGDEIDAVDLSCGRALTHVPSIGGTGATMPTLAAAERALIERTIALHRGNKLKAARQLGISRTKLYAKLAKYGLG